MDIKPIKTKADYDTVLAEIDALMDAEPGHGATRRRAPCPIERPAAGMVFSRCLKRRCVLSGTQMAKLLVFLLGSIGLFMIAQAIGL
jgi:hypothetical protein